MTTTNWFCLMTLDILRMHQELDVEKAFEWTQLGRQIVSREIIESLQAKGQEPLGKLLTWKHPEEVLEHDGRDGRDWWCVVGNSVYDITGWLSSMLPNEDTLTDSSDFTFKTGAEKQSFVAFTSSDKMRENVLDDVDMPDLLRRLAPFRCGYLKQSAPVPPTRQRTFTLPDLGRYIYPEIGMYCSIDGEVYDLGRRKQFILWLTHKL